jgi:dihydrofolate reductase/diadenosine tetraphosphate (Ap4A) HIT family hydrolase
VTVSLVVAADESELIGADGGLPWHISEDLKRFRRLTTGGVVVVGRKTQDSIVARLGHALPDRTTIVVSRHKAPDTNQVRYRGSVGEALEAAQELSDNVFVIGGAEIYRQSLPMADTVHLTRVRGRHAGDTYLDRGWLAGFGRVDREPGDGYTFETWRRSLYCIVNAGLADQVRQMRQLEADGVCLFCPEHLAVDEGQPILHRTRHWTVTPNEFPYPNTRLHLILVPDEHVTDLVDLSDKAQREFWEVLRWVRDHNGLTFYGLVNRSGFCEFTGATIRHVHVHVVQGDVDDPGHQAVRAKLSSPRVDPDEFDARFP